jgi:hypothetical protein
MSQAPNQPAQDSLDPEKVACWYFRLNGFSQFENFVVHPERCGAQRTGADLLVVRSPHRTERPFDSPDDTMPDDECRLSLPREVIDVVIAEVKTNRPCTLNDPWTRRRPAERPPRAGRDRLPPARSQVDQWDAHGRKIKHLADQSGDARLFTEEALRLMGVRNGNPAG